MACSNSNLLSSTLLAASFLIIVLSFSATQALAAGENTTSPASPVSPRTLCKTTPNPAYCRDVLPNHYSNGNVYDYGRFSVRKSLSQARKFRDLIDKYLKRRSKLSVPAVRALEDCRLLAGLNMDFLLSSFETVNKTSRFLSTLKAEDIKTLLSAILTNQQTCLDGIQATASSWSIKNDISVPLANDTKLYSVSLALFDRGWVPRKKKLATWTPKGKQLGFRYTQLHVSEFEDNELS